MLVAAQEHQATQAQLTGLSLLAARRAWGESPQRATAVLTSAQYASAVLAVSAVPALLEEQGLDPTPVAEPAPAQLAGVASDGRSLASLVALADTRSRFDAIVETQLADVSRSASLVAGMARPSVTGYVRVVSPGACARCAILAGRVYRWSTGFLRHPRCSCGMVPAGRGADGLTASPRDLFDQLTPAEQDHRYTKAGAEAIRLGADMGRVVNARRGMSTTVLFGEEVSTTSALRERGMVRLMPETLLQLAGGDRDEAVRLLTLHKYLY